jgi:hypothetical protein
LRKNKEEAKDDKMGDVDMSDAGGVSVQIPTDPLQKSSFFSPPQTTTQTEADLYSKLKKLQRDLEFLSLQEVFTYIRILSALCAMTSPL